jgi:hypothetical protein
MEPEERGDTAEDVRDETVRWSRAGGVERYEYQKEERREKKSESDSAV